MKKIKLLVGVLLIVSAVAGLVFWETRGREVVLCSPVLVAKSAIEKGSPLTASLFTSAEIPKRNLIEGALSPQEAEKIIGKTAVQTIVKNAQISAKYAKEPEQLFKPGESVYTIPKKWIAMRSSGLRSGDWIKVYNKDGTVEAGVYRIAFVKDEAEREVQDAGEGKPTGLLDRMDSTSVISHLEIVTDMAGYQRLQQMAVMENGVSGEDGAGEEPEPSLLIVYDPEGGATHPEGGATHPEGGATHPEDGKTRPGSDTIHTEAGVNQEKGEEGHE